MPCDQIRLVTLDMQNARPDWIQAAATEMGLTFKEQEGRLYFYLDANKTMYAGQYQDGQLVMERERAAQFKTSYSIVTVRETARAKGWKAIMNERGEMQLIKNTY